MALARIITRSEACSRELAVHLQNRGYAVETVSPDNIPRTAADLELRVETGSGDRLTASVIARQGERSSTLEFVRELKSPITASTAAQLPVNDAPAVEILVGPVVKSLSERLALEHSERYAGRTLPVATPQEVPARAPVSSLTSASSEISLPVPPALTRWLPIPPLDPQLLSPSPAESGVAEVKAVVDPVVPTLVATVPAAEPEIPILTSANSAEPAVEDESEVPQAVPYHTFDRAPSLFGNAVLVLIGMALLITLVVGFSLYRSKEYLSNRDKVAPSGATSVSDAKDGGSHSAGGTPSKIAPAVKPVAESAPASKPRPAAKGVGETKQSNGRSLSETRGIGHSAGDTDDLVAKDTVTYLDRRPKTAASKPSVASSRSRSHRAGVIAENTVTYSNGMTGAPKPAK
jgi:hypothetical protein